MSGTRTRDSLYIIVVRDVSDWLTNAIVGPVQIKLKVTMFQLPAHRHMPRVFSNAYDFNLRVCNLSHSRIYFHLIDSGTSSPKAVDEDNGAQPAYGVLGTMLSVSIYY